MSTFKLFIRTAGGDTQIHGDNDIDYYMKRDNQNEMFVLKESGQLRYIRENFNNSLEETLDEYIDYYFKENEKLNEVQRTGHQERDEFSTEKEFLRLQKSSLLKELKSKLISFFNELNDEIKIHWIDSDIKEKQPKYPNMSF